MPIAPGGRFGPHKVTALLGAGGSASVRGRLVSREPRRGLDDGASVAADGRRCAYNFFCVQSTLFLVEGAR